MSDEVGALMVADFIHLHDAGMIQASGGLCFTFESLQIFLAGLWRASQNLQCGITSELQVFGCVHIRHATAAQAAQDLVVTHATAN